MKLVHAAAAATAGAILAVLPAAAHADSYTYADHTKDVVSLSGDSEAYTPAPERVEGDIVSSTVNHRARSVVLRMRYRELVTSGSAVHYFVIRTNELKRVVAVVAGPGYWRGHVAMTNARGQNVRCQIGRSIDYTRNTVTIVVPRSCLSSPRWVRAGMAGIFSTATDSSKYYVDDARTNATLGSAPVYGPRVRR